MSKLEDTINAQKDMINSKKYQLITSADVNDIIENISSSSILDKIQAYATLEAESNLLHSYKMSFALHELENEYVDRALEDKSGMDMRSLSCAIDTVAKAVDRVSRSIKDLTHDDHFNVFIDQYNNISATQNNNTQINVIDNKYSREKIRSLVGDILDEYEEE